MERLSVVLVTYNEERNIDRCLGSMSWADEIIVVDSFSTDRTLELARQYTSHVYQHAYPGTSKQVERGIATMQRKRRARMEIESKVLCRKMLAATHTGLFVAMVY